MYRPQNHEENVLRYLLYKRMPRSARRVLPGFPHQVTQRGTDRQIVFHTQRHRRVYLDLLKVYSHQAGVRILAYCLMSNHIHLIAVPEEEDPLAVCLRRTCGRIDSILARWKRLFVERNPLCGTESGEGRLSTGSGGVSLVQCCCAFEWKRHFALAGHAILELLRWGQALGRIAGKPWR